MNIRQISSACAIALAATGADGNELKPLHPEGRSAAGSQLVILLDDKVVVEPRTFATDLSFADSQTALLKAIGTWLTFEFGLPAIDEPPTIVFATASRMAGLRYRDVASDRWGVGTGPAHLDAVGSASNVIAVYDDEAKIIYLPQGWSGKTAHDLSVLVHEMVHHMQNVAGLKFACPEEREKAAFEAQDRWLGQFGSDLEKEFELDPFTLLVRTNCLY